MKFVDRTRITVVSGKGGKGCMSFRREAYVPKGGPDGGDGGKGGDVVLEADTSLHTLLDCQYQQLYRADNGKHGSGSNKQGRSASDMVIKLPVGTEIYDDASGELLADLDKPGVKIVIAKGGDGGRGNARFASSRNRAPRRSEDGWPGQERTLRLELKLIADVGLVGFPNSGKSTLISAVSNARPKIADYAFTTKVPALGVIRRYGTDFVMADIPGLIENAHTGAGMGDRFLRHIERTRLLLHLIDPDPELEPSGVERFKIILNELSSYSQDLASRTMMAVITKQDIPANVQAADELRPQIESLGFQVYTISAVTGDGVQDLLRAVAKKIKKIRSIS
jgi:GTPase